MADLLETLCEFLNQNMSNQPPVEIIPAVDVYPKEYGFPLVGVLDGPDRPIPGASQDLYKEKVFLTFYSQYLGSYKEAILEARRMKEEARKLFQKPETWAFFGCDDISYKESQKLLTFEEEKDGNKEYTVFKIAMVEFSWGEEILEEI